MMAIWATRCPHACVWQRACCPGSCQVSKTCVVCTATAAAGSLSACPAGGELLAAVAKRGSYSEADARKCFAQLLQGVAYLHEVGIAHRDLKLDNLLLDVPDDISKLRIVDFGLSKGHIGGSMEAFEMATVCGTPHYVAPEIIAVRSRADRNRPSPCLMLVKCNSTSAACACLAARTDACLQPLLHGSGYQCTSCASPCTHTL